MRAVLLRDGVAPVLNDERIAEPLDARVVADVAGGDAQAVSQGNRRVLGVANVDGVTCPVELSP
jgi:hypothetical protein